VTLSGIFSGRCGIIKNNKYSLFHGAVLVSTGVVEGMASEPRTLNRATTGKNNN